MWKVNVPIESPPEVSYRTSIESNAVSLGISEIFGIKAIFHRSNGENATNKRKYPGFLSETISKHISGQFDENRCKSATTASFKLYSVQLILCDILIH